MEFYQELLVTAIISIIFAILIGKLATLGDADDRKISPAPSDSGRQLSAAGAAVSVKEPRVSFREISNEPSAVGPQATDDPRSGPVNSSEVVIVDRSESDVEAAKEVGDEKGKIVDTAGFEVEEEEEDVVVEREMEREEGCDSEEVARVGSLLYGEDEWEGVERSELEKLFGSAIEYVSSDVGGRAAAAAALSSSVQMELYGLQKVAMEGPCHEPQPMALKVSARAKWYAWQRLGNMTPEVAMDKYIALLSRSIPGWMGKKSEGNPEQAEGNTPPDGRGSGPEVSDSGLSLHSQLSSDIERSLQDSPSIESDESSTGPKLSDQGIAKALFLNLLTPTTVRFLSF